MSLRPELTPTQVPSIWKRRLGRAWLPGLAGAAIGAAFFPLPGPWSPSEPGTPEVNYYGGGDDAPATFPHRIVDIMAAPATSEERGAEGTSLTARERRAMALLMAETEAARLGTIEADRLRALQDNRSALDSVTEEMRVIEERRRDIDRHIADLATRIAAAPTPAPIPAPASAPAPVTAVPVVVTLPSVASTVAVVPEDALSRRRDALRVELASLRETRTERHPQVRRLASELASVEAVLAARGEAASAPVSGVGAASPGGNAVPLPTVDSVVATVAAPTSEAAPESARSVAKTAPSLTELLAQWSRRAGEAEGEWNTAREVRAQLLNNQRELRNDLSRVQKQLDEESRKLQQARLAEFASEPASSGVPATLTAVAPATVAAATVDAVGEGAREYERTGLASSWSATPEAVRGIFGIRYRILSHMAGGLVGLLVGGLLGWFLSLLRLRWGLVSRFGDEAAAQCGLPLLGEIPAYDDRRPEVNPLDAGQWRSSGAGFVFEPISLERNVPRPRTERAPRKEGQTPWWKWPGMMSMVLFAATGAFWL